MLVVSHATIRFGETLALDDASLQVAETETVAVLGPSGSGKTTLLRAVAGLEPLARGTVTWGRDDITRVPTHLRGFGLVFQDFALFPHLDVGRNVEFGLRMSGTPAPERRRRVAEALERVELAGYEDRAVSSLSGGQAQRVALARALAPRPRLLLFDEPLGSLDRELRERLALDLAELLDGLAVPAVYVTHDQAEAFTVADHVAVFDRGRVLQVGTAEKVWRSPATERVAAILGFGIRLDGRVAGAWAETLLGPLPVPRGTPDGPVRLVLRPDAVHLDEAGTITADVLGHRFREGGYVVRLRTAAGVIEVEGRRAPRPGSTVRITVDPDGVVPLG